ncbi:MAG: AAA family ATPase [Nanoarchaeota archaeon]|nr:AAA family ATPase [Nanoarchaeota archaeon]
MSEVDVKKIKKYQKLTENLKKELSKVVVGQNKVIDSFIRALFTRAHVLVEGVPGIAKTLLLRSLAVVVGCGFKRVQFTVDLLPTDITGVTAYTKEKGFYVVKGPVFTNFLLADEINRAPPKTQSALLEAMQERQVTIGRETFPITKPFFVMATQNPIESAGTYELPEAQIDRFLFKVLVKYPSLSEEKVIIDQNIDVKPLEAYGLKPITNAKEIIEAQEFTKTIFLSEKIKTYITKIVDSTRNPKKYGIKLGEYIEYGASPRASIGLALAARAEALIKGESFVKPQHIKNIMHEVLRHRIILSYEGMAKKISTDDIINEILKKIPVMQTRKEL